MAWRMMRPSGSIDSRPALEQGVDVGVGDPPAADRDLDAGDVADQPAGREADEDLVDIGAGDPLGLLDRLADRDLALLHVGDEAALDAAALALAGAEDLELAVLARLGDQRADLGRADVERGDQVARRRLRRRGAPSNRPRQVVRDRPRIGRRAGRARARRARARCGHRRAGDRACRCGRSRGRAAGSCWSMQREALDRARAPPPRPRAAPASRRSGSGCPSAARRPRSRRRPAAADAARVSSSAVERRRPGGWRRGPISSGRSGIASTRTGSSTTPSASIRLSAGCSARSPPARARSMSIDQRVGQPPRHPRLLDPAELQQPRAGRRADRPAASPSTRWSKRPCRSASRDTRWAPVISTRRSVKPAWPTPSPSAMPASCGSRKASIAGDHHRDGHPADAPVADPPRRAGREAERFQQPAASASPCALPPRAWPRPRRGPAPRRPPRAILRRHNAASTIRSTSSA